MHAGERIRRIRESKGLLQKYVAREAGLSITTLCRLESGEQKLMYLQAVRLARILMCDLEAFDDALGGPLRGIVPPATPPSPPDGAPRGGA